MSILDHLHDPDRADCPIVVGGEQNHSANSLLAAAQSLSSELAGLGASRVATLIDNGPTWLIADLAIQQLALVQVPLPPFFHPTQVRHALAAAAVDLLICDRPHPQLGSAQQQTECGLYLYQLPVSAQVVLPEGTSLITFTSGTTGQPKGVCLGQRTLEQVAESLRPLATSLGATRHLCLLPLGVLLEQIAGMHSAILAGAELCLPSLSETGLQGASGVDGSALLACIQRYQPHSVILLPQMLEALCSAIENGAEPPTSLRLIAVGGARVAAQNMTRARALGLPVLQGYGLSEAGSVVCLEDPEMVAAGGVGKPLPGREVRIDDQGEVWLRHPGFLGYLGEPPSSDSDWPTGDLGHWDEHGNLHLHGRRSNLLITAFGRNVCPDWVESELHAHPLIAQAFVCGDAEAWLQTVLVAASERTSTAQLEQAVAEVNQRLPDYARIGGLVRSALRFDQIEGLCTANGRLRRAELMTHFETELNDLWDNERASLCRGHSPETHPSIARSQ